MMMSQRKTVVIKLVALGGLELQAGICTCLTLLGFSTKEMRVLCFYWGSSLGRSILATADKKVKP